MKKRFLCALLTLIMLVSLVPATALTASAAGMSISESAITVLKQWNGYNSTCGANGYVGYGTKCEVKATHGGHSVNEKQADTALRAALKDLDAAINSFASSNGLSLTQGQHDALVLFSFDNGIAWTTGTGSIRSAVVNRLTGSEFLGAICRWNSSTGDDNRRKVEANMYLNGVYSSSVPSSFITVIYNPGGVYTPAFDSNGDPILDAYGNPVGKAFQTGNLGSASRIQYYDLNKDKTPQIVPTLANHTFTGWYESTLDFNSYADGTAVYDPSEGNYGDDADPSKRVTSLSSKHNYTVLVAGWVETDPAYEKDDIKKGNVGSEVYYIISTSDLASSKVYKIPNGDSVKDEAAKDYCFEEGSLRIDRDYLDTDGVRWCRIHTSDTPKGSERWVKVKLNGAASNGSLPEIDVTVTVTNKYVRSRTEDSIFSQQNGTYNQGAQLRIINTSSNDGFLWGQVAKSKEDNTPIGWVALMYTNFEEVRGQQNVNTSTAIATAMVTDVAYVNLRSDAGTQYQIVGALSKNTTVSLYEIKYVNGHRWGRCSTGWFCLDYAEVTTLIEDDSYITDTNYLSYVFTGNLVYNRLRGYQIFKAPSENAERIHTYKSTDTSVTITQLTNVGGTTWGKFSEGWVRISDAEGNVLDCTLHTVKYNVTAESLTVRNKPDHSGDRVDALVKGVEFDVNKGGDQIVVTADSVWARAYKVGEDHRLYDGWVNLASTGVSRTTLPTVEKENDSDYMTDKMATVINADNVNVREYNHATYAKIGSLPRGTTVAVWEEEDGWYKVDSNKNGEYDYDGDGWVSGQYLNVFDAADNNTSAGSTGSTGSTGGSVETGLGIVANTYTGVNVRTGAGTGYPANGKILAGTTVEILEVKAAGASKWGRVQQGWICMDYVTMVSNYPIAGTTTGSTGSGNTTNTTASETVIFTGKITADGVKVYTEPNTNPINADSVRTVSNGTPVTVHELMIVEETQNPVESGDTTTVTTVRRYWARTNDGYILDPATCITLDPLAEKTYTVTSYASNVDNELKVYDAANGSVKSISLNKYDTVSVTTLQIVGKDLWCRVEFSDDNGDHHDGYVRMTYLSNGVVTDPALNTNTNNNANTNLNTGNGTVVNGNNGNVILGSTGNTANQGTNGYVNNAGGYRYTGTVIRTGSVNVRSTPSQTASLTTTLKGGAALVIYETVVSEGMAWGRCDAGWVYLYYVDLQPCNTAVDAKVVYNENTIAYTDANCTAVAGTYSRMSVVDIYEQVGSMCRCDLGWVHIDNLG